MDLAKILASYTTPRGTIRDPDDDHVLGCALAASAKVIVTGDKDLLSLHPFRGIAIVKPAAYLVL